MAELPKPLEILVRSDVMLKSCNVGKLLIYDKTANGSETGTYFLSPEGEGELGLEIRKGQINFKWGMEDHSNKAEYVAFNIDFDPRDNKNTIVLKTERMGRKPIEVATFHIISSRESMRRYEGNFGGNPKYVITFENYISRIAEVNQ